MTTIFHFKSGIILKDRVYIPDHDSFEQMLEELNVKEEDCIKVRLEAVEKSDIDNIVSPHWEFFIESESRPEWYRYWKDLNRFEKQFYSWLHESEDVAFQQEINVESKKYKFYIDCTGRIYDNPNIERIFGCNLQDVFQCNINRIQQSNIGTLEDSMITFIGQSNFTEILNSKVKHSYSNKYNLITSSMLDSMLRDEVMLFYDSYASFMHAPSTVDIFSSGMINYYHHTNEPILQPSTINAQAVFTINDVDTKQSDARICVRDDEITTLNTEVKQNVSI